MRVYTILKRIAQLLTKLPTSRGGTGQTYTWLSVTLTRNTSYTPSDSGYTVRYYPYLKMCFVRIYIAPRASTVYKAGTAYTLYTIPEAYAPVSYHAGACRTYGTLAAPDVRIGVTSGSREIEIMPKADIPTSYALYITAWWFMPTS